MTEKRQKSPLRQDRIYVMYGRDAGRMVREVLDILRPFDHLPRASHIGLKPNLVVAKPSDSGATTSVALIEGLVRTLKDEGFHNLTILESSGIGHSTTQAFQVTGLNELAERYQLALIDLKSAKSLEVTSGEFKTRICRPCLDLDFLINLPVVKAHSQTGITCALKNLKGLLPDSEKRRFHAHGLHRPIAALNRIVRQDLIVADGIMGDLTFEEGGTPVQMDRILIAGDPVLLDAFVADCLGYHWSEIAHISIAAEMGVGTPFQNAAQIVELNRNLSPEKNCIVPRSLKPLLQHVDERQACSTCLGGLIRALHRLENLSWSSRIHRPLCIGQGFKGERASGTGIGTCAKGCSQFIPGCPPSPVDIVKFLSTAS